MANRPLYIYIFLCFACFQICSLAYADDTKSELLLGLSGEYIRTPYRDYKNTFSPMPIIEYDSGTFFIDDTIIGYHFFKWKNIEWSIFAEYDYLNEYHAKQAKDAYMKRLRNRHSSVVAGLDMMILTDFGAFETKIKHDILNVTDGFLGQVQWIGELKTGPFSFYPSLGFYFNSSKYNSYYFGISKNESIETSLPRYKAGSDIEPFAYLGVNYPLTKNWGLYCSGEYKRLGPTVWHSPMVEHKNTLTANFALYYQL